MSEIAAELGLSRKTVSVVVNGNEQRRRVSAETVRRVNEHLARRGYVPSRQARHLRAAPARVVGLLYVEGLYTHLIDAFHRLAKALAGIVPDVELMMSSPERMEASVRELLARQVTDLVWIHNSANTELFREPALAGYLANMRTVVYNFSFGSPLGEENLLSRGISLVGVKRKEHILRLSRFLLRLGHRVIALPDVPLVHAGYDDVFTSAGLVVAECPPPFDAVRLVDAMQKKGVTAACFHGDSIACKAIPMLAKMGVRIPGDLTVTGFDGTSRAFGQDLTTQAIPVGDMVAKVCDIVAGVEPGLRHCFDLDWVKGGTHGPPRQRWRAGIGNRSKQ